MKKLSAKLAFSPTMLAVLVVYVGCITWTVVISFTASKLLPDYTFVGLQNYHDIFGAGRWITSLTNLALYAVTYIGGCLFIGYFLAICIDQGVKAEGVFRTAFLFPHSVSFIVTGLVWQWLLNPQYGIQDFIHKLGWTSFSFDPLGDRNLAIFAVAFAAIWHGSGFVMALLLAGLRGVDSEIWKASQIDGIPKWRMYKDVVAPMLLPIFVTCFVLLSAGSIKSYDVVVAMTGGGPGIATEVPAKFVLDYMFDRAIIGRATAGATVMLLTVGIIAAPGLYYARFKKLQRSGR
ncbi:carbohydrate ABC transporter permease [Agrobacterium vitis]|uniref:carbohydrate ABC transporter permease n=1 Tax=Agrobacterium vitis TaxID=373 RepID=UPI002034B2FD|nr:sugar ABC transporter permease [Agrobacterium vitis]MCM2450264.1 sugar ABC transporter permease [Agrobacterium vitis]